MKDILEWKEFQLDQIIPDIHNAKSYNNSELIDSDNDDYIYYITRTDSKNGISRFVNNEEYEGLEKENAITIGDTTATIYYQDRPFVAGPHIIVLRAPWFNKYTCLFLISVLNIEKDKYPTFGRAFSKELIKKTKVLLPVDQNDNIDYKYMEDYLKGLNANVENIPDYFLDEGYDKACWYMDNINDEKFEKEYASSKIDMNIKLSERKWKKIPIGGNKGLFEIVRGKRFVKEDHIVGDVPYYSASNSNNGLTDLVGNPLFIERDSLIYTTFGDCYYVNGEFTASDEISILKNQNMNKYSALFLATIIGANKWKYKFGRKAFQNKFINEEIEVPVNEKEEIDWDFMEKYIKSLPYSMKI